MVGSAHAYFEEKKYPCGSQVAWAEDAYWLLDVPGQRSFQLRGENSRWGRTLTRIVVDHLPAMCRIHNCAHAAQDFERTRGHKAPLFSQFFPQGDSFQELHDQKSARVCSHPEIVDRNHIRVGEARRGACLLAEALRSNGAARQIFADYLHRYTPVERSIDGFIHCTHAASSPASIELVTPRERPRQRHWSQACSFFCTTGRTCVIAGATLGTFLKGVDYARGRSDRPLKQERQAGGNRHYKILILLAIRLFGELYCLPRLPASASAPSLVPEPLLVAIPSHSSLSSSIGPPLEVVV
jgi:hypothetical protein